MAKQDPETQLIKNTGLEKLIQRVEEKNKERLNQLAIVTGNFDLVEAIMSVYNFLTVGLDLIPGELSLEDFETAEAELRKLAAQKIQELKRKSKRSFWFRPLGAKKELVHWEHFLANGYFPLRSAPFGKEVYCEWLWKSEPFDPDDFFDHCEHRVRSAHPAGEHEPTNLRKLYKQLLAKRTPG